MPSFVVVLLLEDVEVILKICDVVLLVDEVDDING